MRIIAGRFKGVRLSVPRGTALRPTTDRVREALFSTLGDVVVGSRVLELFAGTGAFGFEALSRGAESAVFVDRDRRAVESLHETIRALGLEGSATVLAMTVPMALKKLAAGKEKFRIIYLDPPYATDWIARVVADPAFSGLLEAQGLLVVERGVRSPDPELASRWKMTFSRKYGGTRMEIFHLDTGDS